MNIFYISQKPILTCFGNPAEGNQHILCRNAALRESLQDARTERSKWVASWEQIDDAERSRWLQSFQKRLSQLALTQVQLLGFALNNNHLASASSRELCQLEDGTATGMADETLATIGALLEQLEN